MIKKILSIAILTLFLFSTMPLAKALPEPSLGGVRAANVNAIQDYNEVKERYKETKDGWEKARQEYLKTRNSLRRTGSLQREGNLELDITNIKNFLTKTTERMLNHIEILEKWVEMVVQDEELKKEILGQLEEDSDQLENYKLKIENSSTVEELRALGKEIKEFWKETRLQLKKYHGIILSARIGHIIEKAENISEGLHKKIDSLDDSDKQIQEMKDLLENYDREVAVAKEMYEKAKELYANKNISGDDLLKEIRDILKEANTHLRDAHKSLRELVKLYRDYTGNFPKPTIDTQTPKPTTETQLDIRTAE
jgi:hypothetical protein